jgi:hypothetical protein
MPQPDMSPCAHDLHMDIDRPNRVLSADVDLALMLFAQIGRHAAAAFLASRGAGFALTCRVLADPARRRAVKSPPAPAIPRSPAHSKSP